MSDATERVEQHRDDLEAIADRDGPLAPVARELLEAIDEDVET